MNIGAHGQVSLGETSPFPGLLDGCAKATQTLGARLERTLRWQKTLFSLWCFTFPLTLIPCAACIPTMPRTQV
jgi:hypothetical protein